FSKGMKILLLTPLNIHHLRTLNEELKILLQKGYARIEIDGEIKKIEDVLAGEGETESEKASERGRETKEKKVKSKTPNSKPETRNARILVDRLVIEEIADE